MGKNIDGKTQPLLISLSSDLVAGDIIKQAKLVRNSTSTYIKNHVFINRDLTKAEATAEFELGQKRRNKKQSNLPGAASPLEGAGGIGTVNQPGGQSQSAETKLDIDVGSLCVSNPAGGIGPLSDVGRFKILIPPGGMNLPGKSVSSGDTHRLDGTKPPVIQFGGSNQLVSKALTNSTLPGGVNRSDGSSIVVDINKPSGTQN